MYWIYYSFFRNQVYFINVIIFRIFVLEDDSKGMRSCIKFRNSGQSVPIAGVGPISIFWQYCILNESVDGHPRAEFMNA